MIQKKDEDSEESVKNDIQDLEKDVESYIAFTRVTTAMSTSYGRKKCAVGGLMIYTDFNIVFSVGPPIVPAATISFMRSK